MIKIDKLLNSPNVIPTLANMWYDEIGSIWVPHFDAEYKVRFYNERLNDDKIPLTLVAFYNGEAIGTCSIDVTECLIPNISPWFSAFVVAKEYRNKGIGGMLMKAAKEKAKEFGFNKMHLCTFDEALIPYYNSFGWQKFGTTEYNGHTLILMEVAL